MHKRVSFLQTCLKSVRKPECVDRAPGRLYIISEESHGILININKKLLRKGLQHFSTRSVMMTSQEILVKLRV